MFCSEPVSWPHAWHGWCLNCLFRVRFQAGNPPFFSLLLLSASCVSHWLSVALLSGMHLFLFHPHLCLCLSGLLFIMYSYLTMSSDTSPLLSASVYFNPLSLYTSLVFSSLFPLSWSVSFFLPLRSDFSLSNLLLSAL